MVRIKTKAVKNLVAAMFPDYRKREVIVQATERVTLHDLNWAGGTKSEYRACGIDGSSNGKHIDLGRPAPWANPYEGLTVDLPVDCIVARGGWFCGQESTLVLYVHPNNMPKFLTA